MSEETHAAEVLKTEALRDLCNQALVAAYNAHNTLGRQGLKIIPLPLASRRTTIKGDLEAEVAVVQAFRAINSSWMIYSEELGQTKITYQRQPPAFLAVLDGIDGTTAYLNKFGLSRYATMLGIFSGTNPTYGDSLYGGIMEHATHRLFYASQGEGAYVLDIKQGQTHPLHTSDARQLNPGIRIVADTNVDRVFHQTVVTPLVQKLSGFHIPCGDSTAQHYAMLAAGEVEAVIECTRKGNLEPAAAYQLIKAAGGVIMTLDGVSLDNKHFLEFGQDDHIPFIAAANEDLGCQLVAAFTG